MEKIITIANHNVVTFQLCQGAMGWPLVSYVLTFLFVVSPVLSVSICPEGCRCSGLNTSDIHVNCSGLLLTTVPKGLSPNTTALDLSWNRISSLESNLMSKLLRLSALNLSHNGLTYINEGSFNNLVRLQELHLQENNLDISDTSKKVLPTTFAPVSQLHILNISKNVPMKTGYPEQMWRYLPNLQELYMDGAPGSFGDGFLGLQQLAILSLSGGNVKTITSSAFKGLRQSSLHTLEMLGCNIGEFDGQALQYIPTVKTLLMANNPLGDKVLHMGPGFKFMTALELLDLNGTRLGDSISPLISKYLCHSSLKWLSVSSNNIQYMNATMSQCLPNLEVFSLAFNAFNGDPEVVADMVKMPHIRWLDLSSQDHTPARQTIHDKYASMITNGRGIPSITIAPTLQLLDVSNNGIHLPSVGSAKLVTPVHLRLLRSVNTGIVKISGSIYCDYRPSLRELDISNNNIKFFGRYVFTKCDWSSLIILNVGGNNLSDGLEKQKKPFFKPLSGLLVSTLKYSGM